MSSSSAGPSDRFLSRLAGGQGRGLLRSAFLVALIAWVPREIAIVVQRAPVWGPSEISPAARFLVALPFAILAQSVVDSRLVLTVRKLRSLPIIERRERGRFRSAIGAWRRRRRSPSAEAVLIALAYALVWASQRRTVVRMDGDVIGSAALLWELCVALPLLMFALLRCLYRIGAWALFLFDVSRMHLRLLPPHPDRAGGLGLLAIAHASFGAVAFAFSTAWSAGWYDRLTFYHGAIDEMRTAFLAYFVILWVVLMGPLAVFSAKLAGARKSALVEYGIFAARYVCDFEEKWLKQVGRKNPLGTSDISAFVDLQGVYGHIRAMRPFPFDAVSFAAIVVGAVLPILPLLAVAIPLRSLLVQVLRSFLR